MRIRLPEHVELKTEIAATKPDALIAPLLFISLIENAFKHGVSNSKPSFIDLDIHQKGDRIVCHLKTAISRKMRNRTRAARESESRTCGNAWN